MSSADKVNIGKRERVNRLILGIAMLIAAFGLGWWITTQSVAGWSIALFFIVVYQGVRFLLDFQTGTCPLKAELGQRRLDGFFTISGTAIDDKRLADDIRRKSRGALVLALFVAMAATLLLVMVPV